jgi:hypothetical protein
VSVLFVVILAAVMFRSVPAWCVVVLSFASIGGAAPLPVEPFPVEGEGVKSWTLAGGAGRMLGLGAGVSTRATVPPLSDLESGAGGNWHGVASVDLLGAIGKSSSRVMLEVFDPATGEVIASQQGSASGPPVRSPWVPIASSEQDGEGAMRAFDGDPDTLWHSNYNQSAHAAPHWIGVEFGKARIIPGIRCLPRHAGGSNGIPRKFKVEIRRPGGDWEHAHEAETDRDSMRQPLEIAFNRPVEVEAVRLVILEDWGAGFGSMAEFEIPDLVLPPVQPAQASGRIWVPVSHEWMEKLVGRTVGLRLRNSRDATVVVGVPRLERLNDAASPKLFGRSNGGLGPDKIGAGLLGFDALGEHRQTSLTVMAVRPDTPAQAAGLRQGDAVLAVDDRPLAENDLAPGWNWFHNSHEANIGHRTEEALKVGKRKLNLTILRDSEVRSLEIELKRQEPFTTLNPANDPAAAAMLEDMLKFLETSQRDDGSWSGDIIRTTFSALALMATGKSEYRERVQRAVEWAIRRYPKPDDYGNLGFWAGAYAGILYGEHYLATGDSSVLPYMEALRKWAIAGQHRSAWDVPALGHGPPELPYENKSLVAPSCHLLVFEALARRCGQNSEIWELLMPYMEMAWSDPADGGHGALGYNRSYKDREEFWSRSGLFAMAAHLRGERSDMRDAMTTFMRENHPWLRNSHAYGEPGGGLGLLALNLIEPASYLKIVSQYDWWFSLAWEPGYGLRFTQPHMGAPYMGEDDLFNAVYALVLQGPRRNLHLTGLQVSKR